MKQRFSRRLISMTAVALIAVLASGMAVVTANTDPPQEDPYIFPVDIGEQKAAGGELTALATNCKRSYASGSGTSAFNWCFSDDGNIVQLENSAGLEHVAIGTITEGWCVSANHSVRGQTNGTNPNFGLNPPTYPGVAKVAHTTTDGALRVQQRFVQQKANRQINIIMEVENTGDTTLNQVYVTRFIDADLSNTTSSDNWSSGTRSVAVYEHGSARLELIPQSTQYFANSMIYGDFMPAMDEDCYDATADGTIEATGDKSMGVMVQLGTIFPGESKQLKFSYRVSI